MYSTTSQYLCHSESCAKHATKLTIILAASYSLSSSPHLSRSHTRCILLALILDTSYSLSSRLLASSLTFSHSCCAHRVGLIASCRICQLSFVSNTQSNATRIKTALLHVMIVAMDVTLGACAENTKCGSSIYRCTLDIENRIGLIHYTWNPVHVCECDASICCDVPCLDSQHNHGAMTRIIRMPFDLTWLCPEGKCPGTAASRRKLS